MTKIKEKISLEETRARLKEAEEAAWTTWRHISALMSDVEPVLPELLRSELSQAFHESGAAGQRLTAMSRTLQQLIGQDRLEQKQKEGTGMLFDEEINDLTEAIVEQLPAKGQISAAKARQLVNTRAQEVIRDFLA